MASSLSLRVASVFVLLVASFFGVTMPLCGSKWTSFQYMLPYLHTMAAGVMLGLAMIHLLPEASEVLNEQFPDYPLAFAMVVVGVLLVLGIEQVALALHTAPSHVHCDSEKIEMVIVENSFKQKSPVAVFESFDHDHGHAHGHTHVKATNPPPKSEDHVHNETCSIVRCAGVEMDIETRNYVDHDHSHSHGHGHEQHNCQDNCVSSNSQKSLPRSNSIRSTSAAADNNWDISTKSDKCLGDAHNHERAAFDEIAQANSMKEMLLAYALELTTGIHSLIIVVDLGLLGDNEYNTVVALLIALCFHQFVEGIGLGSVIHHSHQQLGTAKVVWFVVIFSLTVSIGVLIGILTSSDDPTPTEETVKGVITSIAAGSLLYSSLAEMTGKYFHHPMSEGKPLTKLGLLAAMALGAGMMAIIGMWA